MGVRRFQIVSPPFPCGVAWLSNVLLELNIKTTHYVFREDHWLIDETDEDSYRVSPRAYDHLRWHLPVLLERNKFRFSETMEVMWEHRLDFARNIYRPTILFMRDPRDAIYSRYVRNYSSLLTFTEYLNNADTWPDHFPNMFGLPPPDTIALYCLFWLQLRNNMSILFIRLEDSRLDPVGITQKVLSFLGVSRNLEEIKRAIESSSVERAKECVKILMAETGGNVNTARKGKINEWKETYSKEQLKYFNTRTLRHLLISLRYSPARSWYMPRVIVNYFDCMGACLSRLHAIFYRKAIKLKADSWAKEIFGDHLVNSKEAKQSATFFCKYLSKFFTVPTIREAVTVSDFPKEPQIVQVMEKFNIIHYVGRYFAIAQSVGSVDFTVIATLQEKYGDNLFVHKSIKKVRKWILKKRERTSKMKAASWVKEIFGDHLVNSKKAKQSATFFCKYLSKFFTVPTIREAVTVSDFPKEPQIVQVMEKFNIIHYVGRYFAIAQSVGSVDFTVIATLQEKYGDNLFVHKSIKKVRKWILKKRERTSYLSKIFMRLRGRLK